MRWATLRRSAAGQPSGRRRWLAAGAAVLLAGACGDGAAPVPAGFTAAEVGSVAFAYPQEWEVLERGDGRVRVGGSPGAGGLRPAVAATLDTAFDGGDLDTYVRGFTTLSGVTQPAREVVSEEAVAVPGARESRLLLVKATAEGDGGAVTLRQWDLLSVDPQDRMAYLSFNAPADDFDEQQMRAILATVRRTG